MTPTIAAPITAPPLPHAPHVRATRDRVLISDVPWVKYLRLLKAFERKRNVRLAYDRGELEIMTTSYEHEGDASFLAHLVEVLTEELGKPISRGGSVTVKRRKWQKGIEPDRCFWIANAHRLAGVKRLDLRIHPAPDLSIEVDVTNSSLDRFGIYAKLGIPELWRLDGDDLLFHTLGPKSRYADAPTSLAFPGVAPADLFAFVDQARTAGDQNVVTRAFRQWVRQRFTPAT